MNDLKVQALLQTLEMQRNNALNALAQLQGEMAVAAAVNDELNKKLESCQAEVRKLNGEAGELQRRIEKANA